MNKAPVLHARFATPRFSHMGPGLSTLPEDPASSEGLLHLLLAASMVAKVAGLAASPSSPPGVGPTALDWAHLARRSSCE